MKKNEWGFDINTTNTQKIKWLIDNMLYGISYNIDYNKINNSDVISDKIIDKILILHDELTKYEK